MVLVRYGKLPIFDGMHDLGMRHAGAFVNYGIFDRVFAGSRNIGKI